MKTRNGFKYAAKNRDYAKENRQFATKSEGLFWHCILKKKGLGYRFLRQKLIGNYILDFYCSKLLLAIEIDGESHNHSFEYDEKRDLNLKILGIKTIRYMDDDILKNMEGVVVDLEDKIRIRAKELGVV